MNRMKHPFASRTMVLRLLCICFFSFLGLAEMQAQVRAFAGVTKLVGCGSGANAGKAEVSVTNATGGSGNYEYSFDNTTTWVTTNKSWLSPSAHTIWVRDRNNHSLTHAMPITVPAAPSVVPVITKEVLYDCDGKPTLKVGVQNPQPSYRYYFKLDNAAAFSSNYIFPNISSGTHTITVKYEDTTVPSPSMLLREDFGVGPENMTLAQVSPGASTTYQKAFDTPDACGYVPNVNNIIDRYYVTNGQKVIEAMCWGNYATPPFYTTPLHGTPPAGGVPRDPSNSDPQARYFMIDLNATGEVFRKKIKDIDGTKNVQIRVKFYNLIPKNTGAILPTLRLKLFNGGTEVFTTPQFVVPEGRTWDTYSFTAPANGYTNLDFVIYSDISGAGGNDLAMDDIEVFQLPDICGIETSDTARITELGVPSIYANVSNCSASNNTVNLVVTPTTSDFSYQYQMDGGTLQTSPTFTGLAMNSTHTFKVHYKPVASVVTIVHEDFGVGANAVANSYVNREYFFESMNGANIIYNGNGVPKDNTAHIDQTVDREYAISTHIHATLVNIWHTPTDASGTPNGRKLLIDLDITKPAFYMRPISVLPHKRVDFSAAIFNLLKTTAPSPCNIPGTQVRVRFYPSQAAFEANQTPIKSQTLALPLSATPNDWKRLAVSLSDTEVGANTSLFFVLDLSGTGGCNDIAVDDIVITQALAECSKDFTTTIKTSVTNAFAGVTKLIGCGASANANKAEVTIANVEGGSGNYEYSFDGITWTASNTGWLSAGTHTVSVRDAATHGCPFDMSVTVPAALAQPTIKTEVFYGCDGRPILKVGVENPDPALNYLYKLDGGAFTTTYIFNNIATGTHQVSVQYEYASAPSPVMLLKETFGSDTADGCLVDPSMTTYVCEAGKSTVPIQGGYGIINGHSGLLNRNIGGAPCTTSHPSDVWVPVKDHTSMGADTNGRFFMVDAKYSSGVGDLFYKKTVKDIPLNSNINVEFFILNLFRQDKEYNAGLPVHQRHAVLPNIRVLLKDTSNNEIAHFDTGEVSNSTCGADLDNWKRMQTVLNSGNNSEFTIEFRANQSVNNGWGNDFCIDDITVFVEPKACGQIVSATTNVTTNPVGVPTFNASISNCSNTNSTITWVVSPTTGYTYTYTIQGGTATSSNVFNGLATGTYTFTVNYAPVSNTIVLLNEDFGAGTEAVKSVYTAKNFHFNTNKPGAYTAYNANGQGRAHNNNGGLQEYEYTIAHQLIDNNGNWNVPNDHTGRANGRMFFANPTTIPVQDIYVRKVDVLPNQPLTLSAAFYNLLKNPNDEPYVQLAVYDKMLGSLITQTTSFKVPHSTNANSWHIQSLPVTAAQVGNLTSLYIVVRMLNAVPGGHDLAVDDIIVKQTIACQTTLTATVANQVQKAFAGVTKLIGCGTAAQAGKAEVTIANVEGGSGTYEYSFDNGLSWVATNAGWVPAGTHTVSVRDGISKSCAYDMSVTVPAALAQPTIKTEVFYACDGKAILNVGVENPDPELTYMYSLDGAAFTTTYVFTNVSSGTHSVSVQYEHRSTPSPYILMKEDFGKGGPMALPGIVPSTWQHQPANGGTQALDCLHEGKYTVAPQSKVIACAGWCWTIPKDHTSNGTDATGRYYAMNIGGALAGQRFYYRDVDNVKPNRPVKYEMYLVNLLDPTCPFLTGSEANIEIRIIDKVTSAVLDTKTTGALPRAANDFAWRKYEGTLNPGNATSIRIEFRDLETGSAGNDFAIDDITVYQDPDTCGQVVSTTKVVTANNQDIPAFTVSKTYDCATGKGVLTVTPTATTGFTYTYTLGSTTYTSTTATFTGLNLEQTYTVTVNYQAVSNTVTLLNEDFGAGTDAVKSPYTGGNLYYDKNINANYTAYNANGQSKAHSGSDLNEGEYTISHNLLLDTFSSVWRTPNDHTGNTNGRIFFVNPSPSTLQTIYAREVNVLPNQALTFSAYFYNLLINTGSNNPKVQLTVYKNKTDYENNSTPLKNFISNEIPRNANNPNAWKQESVSLTATEVGARSSVYVVVSMVNPVSGGHDMAMDDIKVTQVIAPCTTSVTTTLTKGDVATPTLTLPANLSVICSAPTASATISSWIASATATSTCGTATVTHNYSYPSNLCNAGGAVTVTFSTTDPFGNVVTATRVISFATMTLTVTPTTLSVPNGALGGTTSSVVPNITLGGVASPSTNSVTITFSGLPAGVTTDTQGRLVVAPNTPATNTTIQYTVCETGSHSNCTTVSTTLRIGTGSLTVTPTPMTLPNGNAGGTTTPSVLTGVVLNGQPVTDTTSVTLTWNTVPPGATGNNNGTVTVAPNTPAGTYTVSYTVCERLNSTSNCETITSTLTIGTGSLTVTPVTPLSVPNGALGGTTTQSILTGVTLNGTPNPSVNSVTISFSGLPAGVTTDTQGRLVVAPNTPATDTTISYRVCEKVNPSNCQTANTRLVIGTGSLTLTPTPMTLPNGNAGGTTTPSVLTGVVLNGQPVTDTTSVTLTWNSLPPGATGNNNGTVTVAPNTPAGTYTVSYTVCERLNSTSNCKTVTSTLTIGTGSLTVTPVTPLTVPNGALGGTTTQSILTGVTLNGTPNPSVNSVTISFSGLPAGVTTDTQGRLVIAPNTPATDTTISYRVCEKVNPSNCQTASTRLVIGTGSLTVTPTPMNLPNGNAGGTTTPSVLTGVVLNGQPVTDTTSVTLTWNTLPPGATGNNNGTVTVAPNTPAGTYTVSYTVCERLNSTSNCETITSTLTIGTGSLTVTPVTPLSVPNGALGGTTTQSILTGVTLNGTPNPSVNSVTISFSGLPAGVTTDTQGRLVVAPNTPATDTTISYRVCEKVNPSNCQTANTRLVIGTGSLTVTPTPMTLPNGNAGGTTTPSVLTGVVLNGQPVTDTTSVTLTWNTVPPRATGNPDGTVTVAPNTPAGTYTVSYTICERLNSASNNCKTVTSTLTIAPNALTVQSDTFTVTPNGTGTQTTPSVLDNDRIGTQTPTAGAGGTVTITNIVPATPSTAGAKVPSLNPDTGRVEVPANTPAGTYTISYQVCETLNPTNCGPRQTVTVTVTNGTLTVTSTELRVANGSTGGSSVNSVLGGVTLNGQTPPSTSSVTISWNSLPPSFTGNTNGTVSVPAGTASGTYTMTYTVCETLNGTGNCKTVSGTIKVGSGEIVVTPVPLNVANGTTGGTTTPSVLTGVTLNGQTPPNTNSVTLTWNQLPPNSVGNTDGTITVHPNTPAGTYTVSYTVCERLNSGSNCETVTNTITIGGGAFTVTPVTQITVPNGANGGTTTPSVLDGVTLNGQTPTTGPTGNVTLTWNQLPPNATGNPDGTVTIAPNTPAGTYTASYTICERLNGNNNCHTYTTTVQVGTPDLSISPKTYLIPNAAVGGTTSSVLENVTYNGQNPPTTSSVTLTFGSLPSGITTTTNGGLQVTPGTPAGVYSVSYTVCEVLNPSHCVNGVATIAVGNVPVVRPDSFTHSGTSTSTTPSVLDNDTVGTQSATAGVGGNVTITNIQVTPQHPGQPGPTMNPNDGRITVPGDTPAGVYTITYDVCTTATPSTCTSGVATLTVPQPTPVLPNNNMVYTNTTTTTAGNILDGGKVGTHTATAGNGGNVTITITEPATPKEPGATVPTLDPNTGQITVPAGTPTGTYTITYQVCTTATPTSCTTGIATVTVSGTTGAVPPAGDVTANTLINTPVDVPVLPAGTATGSVTIGVPTPPSHGTTTINPDGTITYQPDRDFVGTDSFVYELCNASGCHSGTVTVEVSSELKIYNAISLTGSGRNDHFHIGGIENYPNNVVRIYNRWGVEVFKVEGYDNVTKVFKGISEGRSTVEPADKLPQGTYYYLIEYQDNRNNTYTKVGWLYLKK